MKNFILVVALIFVITILIGWVAKFAFPEQTINITVHYNVAAIIGAVLGGSGVAAAGIGYGKNKGLFKKD